ncbi:CaiB/BaiF CoA transferase family protein [Marimonas lutisalis]|uniref:CaiB/BaiF CoA transferase family protein n=1 Tax=Marimonas lutisalis TaxID=2545756 RepID=UPI0010F65134|nr:CaiB/BaiF CoA-transferase family protein [Marimonas lutisalis]
MLDGIRIIEVEGLGPGPFAAMTLADLGADVIVVHRKGGNPTPGVPERSVLDRGKRSIALDLKDAGDLEVFRKLVATADGLIEGFRPGVMEKLGIGPEACHAINPALVFGRMTGWGQESPLSSAAGHDLNYISMSGALWYAGAPGDAPVTPATLVGDIGGGALYLVVGLLAGIMQARATGRGTVVDAAIYDGSAHMMNLLMSLRQGGGMPETRGAGILDGPHWCRSYRTSDGGWMSVQCLEPKFYAIFLDLLGLSDDPDFAGQFDRALWPGATRRLSEIFAGKTRQEWAELFLGTDACVAPVLSPDEAMAHGMNAARGVWKAPSGVLQAAPAPRFAGRDAWQPVEAPERGQHGAEILAELNEAE